MTDNKDNSARYRVGNLLVDADAFRVENAGEEIPLPKLSFDVLLALVRRAPTVVTVSDLMRAVWPGLVVADETVSQRVRLVREALGKEHLEYIATVRGRGYRLTVPVEKIGEANKLAGVRRWAKVPVLLLLALIVLLAGISLLMTLRQPEPWPPVPAIDQSVAVLPFVNMSEKGDSDYFSDGIAEEILIRLARVPDLRVTPRTSSFALRDSNLEAAEIGRQLSVRYLLEGSVRRTGNRVRVTVKLIDAKSSGYVLTRSFERQLNDIFGVQDEIASAVIMAFSDTIDLPSATRAIDSAHITDDIAAYDLYLEAKYYLQLRGLAEIKKSIEILEEATNRDPEFANAYATLAVAYTTLPYYSNEPFNRHLSSADRAARVALGLDDTLAIAEGVLGTTIGVYTWDWSRAEKHFDRALALEPNNSSVWQWYAEFLLRMRRFEEARNAARHAVQLDPAGSSVANVLGLTHHYLGDNERALEYSARSREFGNLGGYLAAMIQIQSKEYEDAISSWEDAAPANGLEKDWVRPYVEAIEDRSKLPEALTAIDRVRVNGGRTPSGFVSEYVALGELDLAFDALDEELERGLFYLPVVWEPLNAKLRADPRFTELLNRLQIVEYWDRHEWPDQCHRSGEKIICD